MIEKIQLDADRLLLVLIMKKNFIDFTEIEILFIFKPKVVYLRPLLSSLPFPNFWKQNVMDFGQKHVET